VKRSALDLLTLALQLDRQLGLGRQVAAVGRRDDLAVVLRQREQGRYRSPGRPPLARSSE
jgi:hypothetical protein